MSEIIFRNFKRPSAPAKINLLQIFLVILLVTSVAAARDSNNATLTKYCEELTPCKWMVYGRNYKKVNLIISTKTCVCSDAMDCSFVEENLSLGAFVYRCVSKIKAELVT
jgi:hypothetical protein